MTRRTVSTVSCYSRDVTEPRLSSMMAFGAPPTGGTTQHAGGAATTTTTPGTTTTTTQPGLTLIDFDIEAVLRGGDDDDDDPGLLESVLNTPTAPSALQPQLAPSLPLPATSWHPTPMVPSVVPGGDQAQSPPTTTTTLLPAQTNQQQQQRPSQMAMLRVLTQRVLQTLPDIPDSVLPPGMSRKSVILKLLDYAMSQRRHRRDGNIVLHKYAMNGDVRRLTRTADLMRQFRHKTHVNTKNWRGETPLHLVTSGVAAAALLQRGARLDEVDSMGNTPVHLAARYHRVSVLQVMLQHVTDVIMLDMKNLEGYTALHLVVMHQPPEDKLRLALSALVEASVDVNIADDTGGRTALFHAVLRGDELTVRYLVENEAAVNKADFSETTPLQAAEDLLTGEDSRICSILLEKGGFKLPPADRITHRSTPLRARKRPHPNN